MARQILTPEDLEIMGGETKAEYDRVAKILRERREHRNSRQSVKKAAEPSLPIPDGNLGVTR